MLLVIIIALKTHKGIQFVVRNFTGAILLDNKKQSSAARTEPRFRVSLLSDVHNVPVIGIVQRKAPTNIMPQESVAFVPYLQLCS